MTAETVHDGLYQLSALQRGTLNTGHTGLTGTPAWEEDFTYDPTGNWTNYLTKVSGTTTLNQSRTSTKVNSLATIAGSSALIVSVTPSTFYRSYRIYDRLGG